MVIPWCGCGRGLNIEPEYFPLNLFFLLDTFVLECPFWCREGAVWNCLCKLGVKRSSRKGFFFWPTRVQVRGETTICLLKVQTHLSSIHRSVYLEALQLRAQWKLFLIPGSWYVHERCLRTFEWGSGYYR